MQAKLDELIRVTHAADNRLVAVERLPENTVEEIRDRIVTAVDKSGATLLP